MPIPNDRGLALVGNADAGDVFCPEPPCLDSFIDHFECAPPDFEGIVLDPAGVRINLLVFLLRRGYDAP